MKLLFYINSLNHGGAERVVANLANQFARKGYECVLVTSFQTPWEYAIEDNVVRIILNEEYISESFWKRNLILVRKLRKVMKEQRPAIAISFMAEPNFRLLISSLRLNVKKIISVRNDPEKEYPNKLFKLLARNLYKQADGVVFQTREAQEWFPEIIQNKSKIILNQVDQCFYENIFEGTRKGIVSTGRLTAQKNHRLLIDAFAKIANSTKENLYIYGEGELRKELEQQINHYGLQERIFLPGSIQHVEKKIANAKLFVLSSDYEGMPNSLMEAMALGIPCISTDCPCGGPGYLLSAVKDMSLVKVNDVNEMADAMKKLLTSESKLHNVSMKVREQAESFSPQKIIEFWGDYINEVNENED